MDEMMEYKEDSKSVETTIKTTRKEFEDGSSEEMRIEQVEGGYIITKECRYKDKEGNWQWKTERSVTTTDPTQEKTPEAIASRLEEALKNLM